MDIPEKVTLLHEHLSKAWILCLKTLNADVCENLDLGICLQLYLGFDV